MKSACCKHEIVIQTNPKNCEYVIISGAQKKTEDFDIEDAETFELPYENALLKFNSRQKSKNTRYHIKKISSVLGREFQIETAKVSST